MFLRLRILLLCESYQWILPYINGTKKTLVWLKEMGLFHIMHIGLFSLWLTQPWFSFLVGMFQHQLILVADFPFGFRGVKSVYTDLKAFQIHVPDTGNNRVKGEQLHKCTVGTKTSFLFCQSSNDIWYIMDMTKKSWKSVTEYRHCGATLLMWFRRTS